MKRYTPNANMADHTVGARDESHESEASQTLMFCFDIAFQESLASLLSIWSLCFALPTPFCGEPNQSCGNSTLFLRKHRMAAGHVSAYTLQPMELMGYAKKAVKQ